DKRIPEFLKKLEERGWIRRHANPTQSRFWNLVHGNRADMFGVFSPYELQVIHDWIAGDRVADFPVVAEPGSPTPRRAPPTFRAIPRAAARRAQTGPSVGNLGTQPPEPNDFDEELRLLEENVARAPSKEHAMALLGDMI